MRWGKAAGVAAGCVVAALIVAAVGDVVYYRAVTPAAPSTASLLRVAQRYRVRVRRDEWGVPHVLGRTDADAAFGLAYAHAEDDFATIQDVTLAARGVLAAKAGPKAAVTDYLVRLFRIWPTLDRRYGELPADLRAVMEAYADGLNAYAAKHPGARSPGALPFTGKDVAAGFMFKTPFFYGLDTALAELTAPASRKATPPVGSNGVAVAPSRSDDGATRLLVNSHQPYTGPVAWWEAVVESGEGWHVAGGFFPGTPFMLHGHNAHLGWANTVNKPDLVDVYRLTLNPADPHQYRLDGRWRRMEETDAPLRVRLLGPLMWTVHRPVEWSVHGPVLRTDHGVFAVKFSGLGEWRQALQYYRLDKARTQAEWLDAMRLQALPSINYIYADETGTIGYVYNGQFPDRPAVAGVDWKDVLPGDRSDLIWTRYLPFERTPQIWRPKSGFVFNSNNTPFQATGAEDALKPDSFPASMGIQTDMTNRAYRALETFGTDTRISAAAFRRYKFDLAYSPRSDEAAKVRAILALDPGGDRDMAAAQDLLRRWSGTTERHDRAAALAVLTFQPFVVASQAGRPPPALRDAFLGAIRLLKAHYGRIDPEWGDVNRIRRGSVDLPIDGGPDTYRAVYGDLQKDGRLVGAAGDTLVMFVTWDKAGRLSSESIHQFGSATLDKTSPHYADQTPLFAAMRTKPVLFTEDQLRGHVRADYRPGVDR